jgi:hypothetical protein
VLACRYICEDAEGNHNQGPNLNKGGNQNRAPIRIRRGNIIWDPNQILPKSESGVKAEFDGESRVINRIPGSTNPNKQSNGSGRFWMPNIKDSLTQ